MIFMAIKLPYIHLQKQSVTATADDWFFIILRADTAGQHRGQTPSCAASLLAPALRCAASRFPCLRHTQGSCLFLHEASLGSAPATALLSLSCPLPLLLCLSSVMLTKAKQLSGGSGERSCSRQKPDDRDLTDSAHLSRGGERIWFLVTLMVRHIYGVQTWICTLSPLLHLTLTEPKRQSPLLQPHHKWRNRVKRKMNVMDISA